MKNSGAVPELKATENLNRPFTLCGRYCNLTGMQDGSFPDYGWHTKGEMGGIWTHPIKIVDGFWISIDSPDAKTPANWLTACDEFVLGDGGAWVEHRHGLPKFNVVRRQFIPHTEAAAGIDITVTAKDNKPQTIQLNVLVRFDILPVWFSGWSDPSGLKAEVKDGTIVVRAATDDTVPAQHSNWTAALKADAEADSIEFGEDLWGPEQTQGNGISALMTFTLELNPSGTLRLAIAGDIAKEETATAAAERTLKQYDSLFQKKVDVYSGIAADLTNVETPEKMLNDAFLWSKLNMEWMTQTSPIVGTGVVAGYADFPWYFGGDTDLSATGLLAAGLHETAKETLRLYLPYGEKARGRIPHEIVTNGSVYSLGHIMETTLFIHAVWNTYLWTGDEAFLQEHYDVCRAGMMDYTASQPHEDGLMLMEYEDKPDSRRGPLCPTYVVMGFRPMALMARRMGDDATADAATELYEKYLKQIEEIFWSEKDSLYASFVDENNKPVIQGSMGWPGGTFSEPLSTAYSGAAERSRVERAMSILETPSYTSEFGVYLHPQRDVSMPITTGIAAIGEFNYGRLEQGLRYLRMIAKTTGHIMPGGLPEYVHPSGDPELFPPTSCYSQLWSAAMFTEGMVWGLLRLEPDAAKDKITMTPRLPEGWPHFEFRNLIIGNSRINVRVDKTGTKVTYVEGPELDVTIK